MLILRNCLKGLLYIMMVSVISVATVIASVKPAIKRVDKPVVAADVALVARVMNSVDHRQPKAVWKKAVRGERLASGDNIKTGAGSTSILRFFDGTVVRVEPSSELTVYGEKNAAGTGVDRSVALDLGKLGFDVHKKTDEQFRFTSPTSVASIKGTEGVYFNDNESSTLIILTTKSPNEAATLTNEINNKSINLLAGQTGVAGKDGSLSFHKSTDAEKALALLLLPTSNDNDAIKGGTTTSKLLKMKFKTKDGQSKEIDIEAK